jgi:hypothetical protein
MEIAKREGGGARKKEDKGWKGMIKNLPAPCSQNVKDRQP